MRNKRKWDMWTVITLVLAGLFAIFLIYPLISLFISSLQSSATQAFTFENFARFFSKKYYLRGLLNSLKIGALVTFFSLMIGTPIAYWMTMYRFRGKKAVDILIVISMLSPPFIGAYSWVLLLGRNGFVTKLLTSLGLPAPSIYGIGGIVFVMTMKLYPFIYLYLCGALKKVDASLLEAAESMGCRPLRRVINTVLPLVLPTMLAGSLLIFMNAMADFGTPMLIGEGVKVMTTLIYTEYISEMGGSANFAAALATIMALMTSVLFIAQRYVVGKKAYVTNAIRPPEQKEMKPTKRMLAYVCVYTVVLISIIPHLMIAYSSLYKIDGAMYQDAFTLDNYQKVFSSLSGPILNTYLYAIVAIVIIVALAMLVSYSSTRRRSRLTRAIDIVTMFPYILPGSVLGITLLMAFNHKPFVLVGTSAIMVLAFVIRRLPYTLRSSTAILYQINPAVEEASISLGCPPVRTFFRITARLMLPGVFSGAILSWVTVINELSASMLLYTTKTATMSVSVYSQILRANYGSAAALSIILTLTTIVSLLIFFKVTGSTEVSA